MSKTDRQTDKSIWWSITAFNDEIAVCEDVSNYPHFVRTVLGGREVCPETGRLHFQGALQCKSQQRMSAIKKWLPTAHLETARQEEALKRYAMKEETAVDDKHERINTRKFLSMAEALTIIGSHCIGIDVIDFVQEFNLKDTDEALKKMYWRAVKKHLEDDKYDDIGLFSQPQMISAWKNTHSVWVRRAIVLQARPSLDELEFPTPAVPLEKNLGE